MVFATKFPNQIISMNYLFLLFLSGGLWYLFRLLGENPRSAVLAAATLMLAGICGVFAFRVIFDLIYPDAVRGESFIIAGDDEEF